AEFDRINAIKNLDDVARAVARLQYIGVGALYGLYIFQDEKNSAHYAVHLYQGGLGLPDRDYYFDSGAKPEALRKEYVAHVGRMFKLLGDADARSTSNAQTILSIETELAGASRKLEDLRDPIKNYNAMSVDGMS